MKISYKESVPKREDIGVSSYLLYIVILCIILFWVWLQKPRFFFLIMGIKTIFTFLFGITEVLMTMILDQKGKFRNFKFPSVHAAALSVSINSWFISAWAHRDI